MELWLESQSNNAAMQGGFNDEEMTGGEGYAVTFNFSAPRIALVVVSLFYSRLITICIVGSRRSSGRSEERGERRKVGRRGRRMHRE